MKKNLPLPKATHIKHSNSVLTLNVVSLHFQHEHGKQSSEYEGYVKSVL